MFYKHGEDRACLSCCDIITPVSPTQKSDNPVSCVLTCNDIPGGRRSTLVVLHHLQFDLVLLARAQTRLLKGGLWTAKGVKNLTILLFLPAPKKKKKYQSSTPTKTSPGIIRGVGGKKNCQNIMALWVAFGHEC